MLMYSLSSIVQVKELQATAEEAEQAYADAKKEAASSLREVNQAEKVQITDRCASTEERVNRSEIH